MISNDDTCLLTQVLQTVLYLNFQGGIVNGIAYCAGSSEENSQK